jgi:hypothetical protein
VPALPNDEAVPTYYDASSSKRPAFNLAVARFNDTYIRWLRSKRELDSHGEQHISNPSQSRGNAGVDHDHTVGDGRVVRRLALGIPKYESTRYTLKPRVGFAADVFNAFKHQWDAIPNYIR